MDKWDELHKKERLLQEQEDDLIQENNQLQRVNEAYDEHFNEGHYFMSDLQETFYNNDSSPQFEAIRDEFNHESNKVSADLEDGTQELSIQRRKLQTDLEEIIYDKRLVSLEEKEAKK